jgi:signal transduction histidine kinase
MGNKKIYFGVRTRLILIITLLLAGVSGTQFFLNYRQQQAVIGQLIELNREINQTIRDIDRQIEDRAHRVKAGIAPEARLPGGLLGRNMMLQELNSLLTYVDSNIELILTQREGSQQMLDHVARLRQLAAIAQMDSDLTAFQVTLSVMDQMSRQSSLWHYQVSSSPYLLPSAGDVFQVSIPIIEEGQVRFVHMQYQVTDFIDQFRRSRITSLLVSLSVLGLGLIVAFVFSGHFTRPIRLLSDGFNRIEQGDLGCRIDLKRSDELGQLVDGFNQMADRLSQNKELEKSLYRQERLSSLGKLAAGVAHEIKNPLNAINLTLQHLGDKLKLGSEGDRELYDRYSRNIQREVVRLGKIVDTFLNFSRMSQIERSPVNLHELIEEVLTLLARDAHERGVRIEQKFAPGALVKNVDPEKMKTVFLNLVINAIQAMPSGGRLIIATSGGNGSPARIAVEDTGCGIPRENLERIFDLFYSSKEGGSGLGLSIVNNIVRDHGGEIGVTSSLGTGSVFTVTIP